MRLHHRLSAKSYAGLNLKEVSELLDECLFTNPQSSLVGVMDNGLLIFKASSANFLLSVNLEFKHGVVK